MLNLLLKLTEREPDRIVECSNGDYLRRWYVIPRNPVFNIYFHEFNESDSDRAYHDHPWMNMSWILRGSYIEHKPACDPYINPQTEDVAHLRKEGDIVFRRATTLHQLELISKNVMTLFITGPRLRKWGFVKNGTWTYWQNFENDKNY